MFVIVPYQSVGPIRFGMSSAELVQAVGAPTNSRENSSGELSFQYPAFSVRLSAKDQTVAEAGFSSANDVRLGDVNIFGSITAFEKLAELDGNPLEYLGFIVLLNLGITMTGFHDDDPSDRAVTVFARGRWDDLRPDLKEYGLP